MKLPVFRTRVLTRCERDRIFFNFITNLTQIVIIFDAHTRVFTIFKRIIRAVHPIPYRSGRTEEIAWWGFIHLTKIWVCYTTMSVKCYGRINLTSIWITISIGVTIVKLQFITQIWVRGGVGVVQKVKPIVIMRICPNRVIYPAIPSPATRNGNRCYRCAKGSWRWETTKNIAYV